MTLDTSKVQEWQLTEFKKEVEELNVSLRKEIERLRARVEQLEAENKEDWIEETVLDTERYLSHYNFYGVRPTKKIKRLTTIGQLRAVMAHLKLTPLVEQEKKIPAKVKVIVEKPPTKKKGAK